MNISLAPLFIALILPVMSLSQQTQRTLAAQLDELMQARFAAGDFNGTVLVARGGQVVYQRALGFANLEWDVPNELSTKFEIGSMTKQFTAMLILQQVNDGKVRLEGRISDYLPYYRKDTGTRVTVSQLLSHTSGVPNFADVPGFFESGASRVKYSAKEFVEKYCSGDLQFEPGSKFEYSNSGYFLMGAILEQVTGQSYEKLLSERIFAPLGMKDSGYTHAEAVLPHRAAGYERTSSGLQNARCYDMSIPFAAGAVYSTVGDLLLWDEALYGERLLPARLRNLLFKPNQEDYGYGWVMLVPKAGTPYAGESIPMHGGAIFGYQSVIQHISTHHELIVLLDNTDSPKLYDIALAIRTILAENPPGRG